MDGARDGPALVVVEWECPRRPVVAAGTIREAAVTRRTVAVEEGSLRGEAVVATVVEEWASRGWAEVVTTVTMPVDPIPRARSLRMNTDDAVTRDVARMDQEEVASTAELLRANRDSSRKDSRPVESHRDVVVGAVPRVEGLLHPVPLADAVAAVLLAHPRVVMLPSESTTTGPPAPRVRSAVLEAVVPMTSTKRMASPSPTWMRRVESPSVPVTRSRTSRRRVCLRIRPKMVAAGGRLPSRRHSTPPSPANLTEIILERARGRISHSRAYSEVAVA